MKPAKIIDKIWVCNTPPPHNLRGKVLELIDNNIDVPSLNLGDEPVVPIVIKESITDINDVKNLPVGGIAIEATQGKDIKTFKSILDTGLDMGETEGDMSDLSLSTIMKMINGTVTWPGLSDEEMEELCTYEDDLYMAYGGFNNNTLAAMVIGALEFPQDEDLNGLSIPKGKYLYIFISQGLSSEYEVAISMVVGSTFNAGIYQKASRNSGEIEEEYVGSAQDVLSTCLKKYSISSPIAWALLSGDSPVIQKALSVFNGIQACSVPMVKHIYIKGESNLQRLVTEEVLDQKLEEFRESIQA